MHVMREDLQVWCQFLTEFKGLSFWRTEVDFQVHLDAAGSEFISGKDGVLAHGLKIGINPVLPGI